MADVFISYKREERQAVKRLAQELRRLGLDVWFDASLNAGEAFSDEIDREAHATKAILVCWSPTARESQWVKSEALIGFGQRKLAACYVAGPDGFHPPTPFDSIYAEDLRTWVGAPSITHAGYKSILRRIGALCRRADIESYGALDVQAPAAALRTWIERHQSSPLFMVVDELLHVRNVEEAERTRFEQEARERRAREEAERRAREDAKSTREITIINTDERRAREDAARLAREETERRQWAEREGRKQRLRDIHASAPPATVAGPSISVGALAGAGLAAAGGIVAGALAFPAVAVGVAVVAGTAAAVAGTVAVAGRIAADRTESRTVHRPSFVADAVAFAPKALRRATPELIQISVHQTKHAARVVRQVRQADPSAKSVQTPLGLGAVKAGASIGVALQVMGAQYDGRIQRQTWIGTPLLFPFSVDAEDVKQVVIIARLFVGDAEVGTIAFKRPVTRARAKRAAGAPTPLRRHKRVFLSYSSKDRDVVSKIATAYRAAGVQHFWDRTSLESGEEWSPRLRKEIERSDLFHLCWSKAAAQSEWVEKEAKYALVRRRRSGGKHPNITVQMLDGPPWAPHPKALDSINFDDFVRAAVVGYARGETDA